MTNTRTLGMISMRLQGYTLNEIGENYGITRERVRQIFGVTSEVLHSGKFRGGKYPALGVWMFSNDYSQGRLAVELGIAQTTLSAMLKGGTPFKKRHIDKLIELTGMTYEELFKENDEW